MKRNEPGMGNMIMATVAATILLSGVHVANAAESASDSAPAAGAEKTARRAKWHVNFKDAQAEAEKEKLPILLLYTAPGWCGPCRSLESEVLDTKAFMEFANKNLVLLKADCSKPDEKEAWLAANKAVAEKYEIKFFPNMYFLSSDTKQLGNLGGYEPEWNVQKYIEEVGKIVNP